MIPGAVLTLTARDLILKDSHMFDCLMRRMSRSGFFPDPLNKMAMPVVSKK